MTNDIKRRTFLKYSMGVGVGLLAPGVGGCNSDDVCSDGKRSNEELEIAQAVQKGAIQKGPFVQFLGPKTARLRFETTIDEPTAVTVRRNGGSQCVTPDRDAQEIDYGPVPIADITYAGEKLLRDLPGLYVLHTVLFEDLKPGETVSYTVEQNYGKPIEGEFKAPPAAGAAFRLGWIADTMSLLTGGPIKTLAAQEPDLILHGGDIVYATNPLSTWNKQMLLMAPLFNQAAMHFCVGNHEFEPTPQIEDPPDVPLPTNEIHSQFDRLFRGQGGSGTDANGNPARYGSFVYGGVCFILLDSETKLGGPTEDDRHRELLTDDSMQIQWLDETLANANANPDIRHIVVCFHRPLFTWSKYGMGDTAAREREVLRDRFKNNGVSIVLNGHMHAYQYFDIDNIQYIVDGGGGGLMVDPEEKKSAVLNVRPEEKDQHVMSSKSYGVTTIDFHEDGSFTVRRFGGGNGEKQLERTIPA